MAARGDDGDAVLDAGVASLVDAFQRERIVPHCPSCARPCCALTDVVLDLSFPEVQALYRITSSKKAFDAALPATIRAQGGRYYAHGAPCPAFDTTTHRCGVYATTTKPRGCSDFPVYDDGGAVTVDLRCEAVRGHLTDLRARLAAAGFVDEHHDEAFPETFVSFTRRAPRRRSRAQRTGGEASGPTGGRARGRR